MSTLPLQQPREAFPDPVAADHVRYNPTFEALRSFSAHLETTTEYGAPSYVSDVRSRSADRTANAVDADFGADDWEVVEAGIDAVTAGDEAFVCVDRQVGRHPEASYHCRLFVPREYARIALSWAKLNDPAEGEEPDFVTVQYPDHDERAIRVLPEEGVTVVLGTDYTGEAKKSFLRLFMERAKRQGGLGLHAGSKRLTLADGDGTSEVGQVFLGLSGTGKSTLTGHGYWLDGEGRAELLQDDVCALLPDGTVVGSEGGGMFIKTDGLAADEQPELYGAATDESAVLDNVAVDDDGTVHFDEPRHTKNGRAVVERDQLPTAAEDIDLEGVDQLFFITRNPLMPPVAKLSTEQAAASFMLGESIETSAGDPERAGEAVRVVGTNPFIVGSEGEEGNRFYELVQDLDVDCYLLNTGEIGGEADVGVEDTVAILTAIARGTAEWTDDDALGLTVPASVPGTEVEAFYPPDHVEDFEAAYADLREERRAYLAAFEDLDPVVADAAY